MPHSLLSHPPLLLGAGGMLHRAWTELLHQRNIPHTSLARRDLDLTRPETIPAAIPAGKKLVINCAAWTDVDGAEQNEPAATAVNGTGVLHLANHCREIGALLVHFSTDYIFDGRSRRPYLPDDPTAPLNAYGRSKLLGEQSIRQSGCQHLIVRTSWLYAPWGKNFVLTISRLCREGRPLKIVNDQTGRPTSAQHLAKSTLALIEHDARGIYHVTDGGQCTWFDFAREIARLVNPAVQVAPWSTAELNRPAARPAYSVLDLTKSEQLIGAFPSWQENLARALESIK